MGSVDVTEFNFDKRNKGHLGAPGVSVSNRGIAVFNRQATDIINGREFLYCNVGVAMDGRVIFVFSEEWKDGCNKVSGLSTRQARVSSGGRLKTHAAVPVEIDGDYFIAKFD